MLQTSSPSYLLMASLDAARHQAVHPTTWAEPLQAAQRIRDGLTTLHGISVLDGRDPACAGMLDPTGGFPKYLVFCGSAICGLIDGPSHHQRQRIPHLRPLFHPD